MATTTPPTRIPPGPRRPGRPRSQLVEQAILDATTALLTDVGPERTTIAAVAARSGVARATIYLRWPDRQALIVAAIRRAFGRDPIVMTGDLEHDIRVGTEQSSAIMAAPGFRALLPAIVAGLLDGPPASFQFDAVAPGMARVRQEYAAIAAESGFRTDVQPGMVGDLIVGTILSHLLVNGTPATAETASQVAEIVIAGLRSTAGPGRR
jgi:AcrR family transcriptional regulator